MTKIRFTNVSTGAKQDADGALPIDAANFGASGSTVKPKAYRVGSFISAVVVPENTVPPIISGFPGVGQSLSLTGYSFDGATAYTYRWLSGGTLVATTPTYTVQDSDRGRVISAELAASAGGPSGAFIPATNFVFIPVVILAVVLDSEWEAYEALSDAQTRRTYVRVNDNPTEGYQFCAAFSPSADVATSILVPLAAVQSHYETLSDLPAPVGTALARTQQTVRIAERLIADPNNSDLWRWVSGEKSFAISSVPTPPTFTVTQGTLNGEIIFNLTAQSSGSGRAVTAVKYRVDSGISNTLSGLEIGTRSLLGFTPLQTYSFVATSENANGESVSTAPVTVVAGQPVAPPGSTTTLVFPKQQITIEGSYTVVTHIDGVKCIVSSSPVVLREKTPAVNSTLGAVRNGFMKNPERVYQSFDSRCTTFQDARLASFPITLSPNDWVVSAVSMAEGLTMSNRDGYVDSYDMVYVSSVAPNPLSLGPVAFGWPGRTTLESGAVIDYVAKAALLPTTYSYTPYTYPSEATIDRALRFNPMMGFSRLPNVLSPDAGYERMNPFRWGGPVPGLMTGNSNYGQWVSNRIVDYMWMLYGPLDRISLAQKAKILMRIHSYAWQTSECMERNNQYFPGDGGHFHYHQAAFGLMYWITGNEVGLDNLKTRHAGNWRMFFYLTEDMVPEWFQPWGDPDNINSMYAINYPAETFRRRIISVDPVLRKVEIASRIQIGAGAAYGSSSKSCWNGLKLTRESDGAAAVITGPLPDWPKTTVFLQLASWPDPGFAVGEVVTAQPPNTNQQVGDPDWAITYGPNKYSSCWKMSYRDQAVILPSMAFLRVLGLARPDWQAAWDYAMRCEEQNNPIAGNDYPVCFNQNTLFSDIWPQYKEVIKAVVQPNLAPPPVVSPFYPDVPDVNLAVEGGALKFPEGNFGAGNADSDLRVYKGALYQTDANLGNYPASTTAQALFAIVRLPNDKKYTDATPGIFGPGGSGGSRTRLWYNGKIAGVSGDRNKFTGYQFGNGGGLVTLNSATWTEDSALVVFQCNGASSWSVDWYSLETGTKFPGTPVTQITSTSVGSFGASFGIGGNFSDFTAFISNNGTRMWPGELEAIGIVRKTGGVSDADWQSIALGADIVTVLGAANIPYLKQYDKTTAALVKPASATSDLTENPVPIGPGVDPVLIPTSRLLPGSTIRRQSASSYLTIDLLSEGWVYGLVPGQVTRMVPFSGKATGYTGDVEVRVYDASNGDVVRNWTVAGAISAGVWSGTIELPKGNGWWFCEARVATAPTVKAYRRTEFSVGYKILLVGQSQMLIGLLGAATTALTHPQSFSYAFSGSDASQYPRMVRVGTSSTRLSSDGQDNGLHWFGNQFRKFDPSTPFMVIGEAVTGTSMPALYNDTSPGLRLWAWLQSKLDTWGNDVTVIGHQWATSDGSSTGTTGTTNTTVFKERLDALFLGTGAQVGAHNFTTATPDAIFAISPATRYALSGSGSYDQHNLARYQATQWAYENGAAVGPPTSDYRISDGGGPHPNSGHPMGSSVLMSRMATAVARSLGLDVSKNPYFTTAAFNPGKTTVTVSVGLPNGGTLYSPSPTALRSFEVQDGGVGGWGSTGFSAVVSGDTVVLTKTTGAWLTGTKVRYLSGLENRAADDGATEDLIIAGTLYETWDKDTLGRGLPLIGSRSGADWYPDWTVTVSN